MKKYVIIVAGGSGSRMQMNIPKQFLLLNKKPVLFHTIEAFKLYDSTCNIILVLPKEHFEYWNSLCEKFKFKVDHQLVEGGETRFYSVKNGLNLIDDKQQSVVAIHDGVRPLVSKQTITECFNVAFENGNAIPVVLLNDSIRKVEVKENYGVARKNYRLVQTPQCFRANLIKEAYKTEYSSSFTDDASVLESSGVQINLVQGNSENIKITTPLDLVIAEAMMGHKPIE